MQSGQQAKGVHRARVVGGAACGVVGTVGPGEGRRRGAHVVVVVWG